MEVHVRNLPPDLEYRSLHRQLDPFMKRLNIKYFQCEKPRGKPFGFIIFANPRDALDFLARHGQIEPPGLPRMEKACLCLWNKPVFCSRSTRPDPDAYHVRSIRDSIDKVC